MKCECGKKLSEKEQETNELIAKRSGTPKLNMCEACWDSYVHHAITGE